MIEAAIMPPEVRCAWVTSHAPIAMMPIWTPMRTALEIAVNMEDRSAAAWLAWVMASTERW